MKMIIKSFKHLTTVFLVLLIVGCGSTAIIKSHPLLTIPSIDKVVKVYFIRPDPGFRGVMGNAFTILLDEQELLTIAKGEYTLVYLKPYSGIVTVESTTVINRGGMNSQTTVKESLPFKFDEGKTYYITFNEHQRGMMQGTSHIPVSITRDAARNLASKLKPIGKAINAPLSE